MALERQFPGWDKEDLIFLNKEKENLNFLSDFRSNVCYCRTLGTYRLLRCQLGCREIIISQSSRGNELAPRSPKQRTSKARSSLRSPLVYVLQASPAS